MSSDLKRTADLYLPLVRSTVNHPSVTMCSAPTSPQCYLCGLVGPGGGDISVCTFTADIQHWLHVVCIADNIIMLFFLTDTSTMTSWPLTCGTSLDFFFEVEGVFIWAARPVNWFVVRLLTTTAAAAAALGWRGHGRSQVKTHSLRKGFSWRRIYSAVWGHDGPRSVSHFHVGNMRVWLQTSDRLDREAPGFDPQPGNSSGCSALRYKHFSFYFYHFPAASAPPPFSL